MTNLSIYLGSQVIPVLPTPQIVYALLQAKTEATKQQLPLNVCLVLDRSPSMFDANRVEPMKRAAKRVISLLDAHDYVSIILFDEGMMTVASAQPADDTIALMELIDDIPYGNDTHISQGLQAGLDEVSTYCGDGVISRLILLTDGQTHGDEEECRVYARRLGEKGVPITALGLGEDWNEILLDDLASLSGGTSDYIANPTDITKFFGRAVKEAKGVVAKDGRFVVRCPEAVAVRTAYAVTPLISQMAVTPGVDGSVVLACGELTTEHPSSVLVELLVPACPPGTFRMADVQLRFTPLSGGAEVVVPGVIDLMFVSGVTPQYDPAIMNLAEKVSAFKLQTRALRLADAGDGYEAAKTMRLAQTKFESLGQSDLAQAAADQAAAFEQGTANTDATKKLQYGTRRLAMPDE